MSTNIRILLAVIFLDGMVMGIVIPATPHLIAQVQDSSISDILIWSGILTGVFGVAQFAVSPFLGALSDVIGRRKVLLIAHAGMALEFVILLIANALWLILLSRALSGAFSANRAVVSAAITDSLSEKDRAGALGKQTAAFAAGLVFGPTIGSLALAGGIALPFGIALLLIVANFLCTAFLFQETYVPNDGSAERENYAHRALIDIVKLVGTPQGMLLVSYLFYSMAFSSYPTLWSYYAQGVLDWSPLKLGMSMTCFCASLIVANAVFVKHATKKLGENRATQAVLIGNIAAALFLATGAPDLFIFLALPFIALMSIADPLLLAAYSKMAGPEKQGLMQGQMSAMRALAIIFGPPFLGVVLAQTTGPKAMVDFQGMIFVFVAAFYGMSLLFFMAWRRRR